MSLLGDTMELVPGNIDALLSTSTSLLKARLLQVDELDELFLVFGKFTTTAYDMKKLLGMVERSKCSVLLLRKIITG